MGHRIGGSLMAKFYRGRTESGIPPLQSISVVSESAEEHPAQPYGTIEYKVRPRSYITNFAPDDDDTGYSKEYLRHVTNKASYEGDDKTIRAALGHKVDGTPIPREERLKHVPQPDQLFTEIKPRINVSSAFLHKKVRPHMGTMFGIVLNEHGTDAEIETDSSLSEQSSRLAHRAKGMGLNVVGHEDNPFMEANNWFDDFSTQGRYLFLDDLAYSIPSQLRNESGIPQQKEIHPAEVQAGRQTMRNLVNKGKTAKPKSNLNPNQLSLFDDNG